MAPDKRRIIETFIQTLRDNRTNVESAMVIEQEAAVEAPGAMESRYDTTKAEKQRLVASMRQTIAEISSAIASLESLEVRPSSQVEAGALIEVRMKKHGDTSESHFFIFVTSFGSAPPFMIDKKEVRVMSWSTPVVQQLRKGKPGQIMLIQVPAGDMEYTIVSIQ